MFALLYSLTMFVIDFFKSPRRLEAENLFLRHQLSIALRRAPPRLRLRGSDRALLVWMTRLWPSLLGAAQVVQPETILRWHRAGFRAFGRWKSRKRAGRPKIDRELRDLIRRMSKENPRWGASRIHGELLMLGFAVAQSTVSKYMVQGGSPSQGWKTFLRNHAQAIAAIDLFVVPTLTFERLSLGRAVQRCGFRKPQIRAYRWCSPPRIGCAIMSPNRSIGRVQGASLPSERCVCTSLW